MLPRRLLIAYAVAALAAGSATAAAADAPPYVLRGTTHTGADFDLVRLRGKVVMLFYWSTDCAVCRQNLPELRANAEGWRGKPFALISVNVDRGDRDWRRYEEIAALTLADSRRLVSLWSGASAFVDALEGRPARLPLTLVLDQGGRELARYEGRMAPEAWDAVAERLP